MTSARLERSALFALCIPVVVGACGAAADAPPPGGFSGSAGSGAAGDGSAGAGGSGGGGAGGAGGTGPVLEAGPDSPIEPDAACGLVTRAATSTPLNLYVMMDRSSSMDAASGTSKWAVAVAGLGSFVDDPASAGIRIALRFFPRPADATPACDQRAYQEPEVPYGELPGNAGAFKAALAQARPDGLSTPTYPALGGAILKGIEVARQNPGEASAVLLVTDGAPQGPAPICSGVNPELTSSIAGLAAAGAAFSPPVLTYVVGLPGVDQTFADAVAQAGGSTRAIVVGVADTAREFREALATVRGQALPCEYELPEEVANRQIAFDRVNVLFTPTGGAAAETILQSPGCSAPGGWRYDDPADPTRIVLCPDACARVKGSREARLEIRLGCQTEVVR